jgi:hypothetical protein
MKSAPANAIPIPPDTASTLASQALASQTLASQTLTSSDLAALLTASTFPHDLEHQYQRQQQELLALNRTAFVQVFVIHCLFLVVDWFCLPEHRPQAVAIRLFFGILPAVYPYFLLTTAFGKRHATWLHLASILQGVVGVTLLIALAAPHEPAYTYYPLAYTMFFLGLAFMTAVPFHMLAAAAFCVVLAAASVAWQQFQGSSGTNEPVKFWYQVAIQCGYSRSTSSRLNECSCTNATKKSKP